MIIIKTNLGFQVSFIVDISFLIESLFDFCREDGFFLVTCHFGLESQNAISVLHSHPQRPISLSQNNF